MIISASRRTDMPACFPKETIEKIIAINSESTQQSTLFKKNNVDAVVFWTKNARPIMSYLNELDELNIPYYFQYTMNDYPKLEPGIPQYYLSRVETFAELSEMLGKHRIIWRYDPFFSCNVPVEYTISDVLNRFEFMGNMIHDYTDKLVFSFLDTYNKMPLGLNPPTKDEEKRIVDKILELNKMWKLKIASCAEESYTGVERNKCIDPVLLKRLDVDISDTNKKDSSQRQKCGCYPSKDIGEYHSCTHQCAYCYAK
jgi:hypothetical protein